MGRVVVATTLATTSGEGSQLKGDLAAWAAASAAHGSVLLPPTSPAPPAPSPTQGRGEKEASILRDDAVDVVPLLQGVARHGQLQRVQRGVRQVEGPFAVGMHQE